MQAPKDHNLYHQPQQEQQQQQQKTRQSPAPAPHEVVRLSSESSGAVTMAAPSPLVLGLGPGKSALTFLQWQELQHQALIYKYLAAGIPVPLHLVLPIWKSVAAASPSLYGSHLLPSFMMQQGGCLMDYGNSMEPEPGRCRRTDGKKWRCSRDVVSDQKYCERHIHRGRNRSRKPVEPAAAATATIPANSSQKEGSNVNGTQLSISILSGGLQLMPAGTATSGGSSSSNSNNVSPPRLGFSPTSVLQSGNASRAGPP